MIYPVFLLVFISPRYNIPPPVITLVRRREGRCPQDGDISGMVVGWQVGSISPEGGWLPPQWGGGRPDQPPPPTGIPPPDVPGVGYGGVYK